MAGLDTEIVENEMPNLLLDAVRESRDPLNRGADRLGNRRLLAEVGKRVGVAAMPSAPLQVHISISAAGDLLDAPLPPGGTLVVEGTLATGEQPSGAGGQ